MEVLRDRRMVGIFAWSLTQLFAFALGICYFASASDASAGQKFALAWKGLWFWASIGATYLLLFRKGTENAFSLFLWISLFLNQTALLDSCDAPVSYPNNFKSLAGFGWTYFFVSLATIAGIISIKEEFVDIGPSFDDGANFGTDGDYHGPV